MHGLKAVNSDGCRVTGKKLKYLSTPCPPCIPRHAPGFPAGLTPPKGDSKRFKEQGSRFKDG